MIEATQLAELRRVILESLRVQRDGPSHVPYIDVAHNLTDIAAKQNHVIFARRGCGKSLLLHHSANELPSDVRSVYLNCEDFKTHSFPNVLIEILDAIFKELETNLTAWFGRKKRLKQLIREIRNTLADLRRQADDRDVDVKESAEIEASRTKTGGLSVRVGPGTSAGGDFKRVGLLRSRQAVELEYRQHDSKSAELNRRLPDLKEKLREFFELSADVKALYVQIDDFYHLRRIDQPHVMDYVHRLCKDLPLYFKISTLRHASVLFAERDRQPTGAQARHDYQPLDIDFTLSDLMKTERQLRTILHEFGRLAGLQRTQLDALFKGQGFRRLVLAGGGVPRDFLSLFLEAIDIATVSGDGRIGKDDIRSMSLGLVEKRVEELKMDSERDEQDALFAGIYMVRQFCMNKKSNAFLLSEQELRDNDLMRELINRLLDYRIIHQAGAALTHKSRAGTYRAFVIDIGFYGYMRKLQGRFAEIDLASTGAKERLRSAPILDATQMVSLEDTVPQDPELALVEAVDDE